MRYGASHPRFPFSAPCLLRCQYPSFKAHPSLVSRHRKTFLRPVKCYRHLTRSAQLSQLSFFNGTAIRRNACNGAARSGFARRTAQLQTFTKHPIRNKDINNPSSIVMKRQIAHFDFDAAENAVSVNSRASHLHVHLLIRPSILFLSSSTI